MEIEELDKKKVSNDKKNKKKVKNSRGWYLI